MVWTLFSNEHASALIEMAANDSSDRIAAILGGVLLDDALKQVLVARFRIKDGNTDMNEKLFKISGPLGNTGPKIDLSYQLLILDKQERNTMHGLSEIRNYFAHNLDATFESKVDKMTGAFLKICLHERISHYFMPHEELHPIYKVEDADTNREKFLVNLKLSLSILANDLDRHYPNTNIPLNYKEE